jgi:hypothetical protein
MGSVGGARIAAIQGTFGGIQTFEEDFTMSTARERQAPQPKKAVTRHNRRLSSAAISASCIYEGKPLFN